MFLTLPEWKKAKADELLVDSLLHDETDAILAKFLADDAIMVKTRTKMHPRWAADSLLDPPRCSSLSTCSKIFAEEIGIREI